MEIVDLTSGCAWPRRDTNCLGQIEYSYRHTQQFNLAQAVSWASDLSLILQSNGNVKYNCTTELWWFVLVLEKLWWRYLTWKSFKYATISSAHFSSSKAQTICLSLCKASLTKWHLKAFILWVCTVRKTSPSMSRNTLTVFGWFNRLATAFVFLLQAVWQTIRRNATGQMDTPFAFCQIWGIRLDWVAPNVLQNVYIFCRHFRCHAFDNPLQRFVETTISILNEMLHIVVHLRLWHLYEAIWVVARF